MFERIKKALENVVSQWLVRKVTVENVRVILEKVVADLKSKAAETEISVDDWAVEFLEMVVASDEKLELIIDKIKALFPISDGAVCYSGLESDSEDWAQLANDLAAEKEGIYSSGTTAITGIVQLLQIILPIFAEYFAKRNGE